MNQFLKNRGNPIETFPDRECSPRQQVFFMYNVINHGLRFDKMVAGIISCF